MAKCSRQGIGIALVVAGTVSGSAGTADQLGAERLVVQTVVAAQHNFNSSVHVSRDGIVVFAGATGWRDRANRKRVDRATLFNIASATKAFTATAILQQIEAGKLSIHSRIGSVFAHVPSDKASITIEQLLTHTSGLAPGYAANGKKLREAALKSVFQVPLAGKPGVFRYTDDGYAVLAAAVEVTSGTTYCAFVRTHIFAPAGMHSRCWEEVGMDSKQDTAEVIGSKLDASLRSLNWGYIGSGGLWASADDLAQFFHALESHKLLHGASLQTMWKARVPVSIGSAAFGWFVSRTKHGETVIVARGNEDWGHSAMLSWYPARRTLITVVTNSGFVGDEPRSRTLSNQIEAALRL